MKKKSNGNERQSDCNRGATYPNIPEYTIKQEEQINVQIIKRIISEKNITKPYLRNKDWKTVEVESEKKNKQIINRFLNEQHHGSKETNLCWRSEISLCKIGVLPKKMNRHSKRGWEIRFEMLIRNL